MRRTAVLLALATAAAAAVPALATDAADLGPQSVTGTIAAPVPANVPGAPRRAGVASTATNGVIGWYFTVAPTTVGGTFDLAKGVDPSGQGDLNIIFYSDPGDAAAAAPSSAGEFTTVGVGGEKGLVPEGAKTGLVFLTGGAGVGFSYKAEPAVLVALTGSSLDATVKKGAPVRFVNDTPDAVEVVSDAKGEGGDPLFTTGELAPGSAASVVVEEAGVYTFTAGTRTGTLTVTG